MRTTGRISAIVLMLACGLAASVSSGSNVEAKQPAAAAVAGAPATIAGKIDAVTVYRGQAMVTRVIDVSAGGALREIVVPDLPEAVVPASLYAEASAGIEVRSVRYVTRPVQQDARENVRALEQQIRAVQDQAAAAQAKMKLNDQHAALLDKMENFVAPTASAELTKGVLNAETLGKIIETQRAQRQALVDSQQKLALEVREANEKIAHLQREHKTLTQRTSKTAREAVVFISGAASGGSIRLSYLVDQANWSPSYNLRRNADGSNVTLEYQASVRQMSGEDWSGVKMTLSTATPALLARGPELSPLRVALAGGQAASGGRLDDYAKKSLGEAKEELARKQRELEAGRNVAGNFLYNAQIAGTSGERAAGLGVQGDFDGGLAQVANDASLLDLVINERVERRSGKPETQTAAGARAEEGVSVTYQLPSRTSLPSRADDQLIQIASTALPMTAAKVARPALTSYVYDQATITNTGDNVLLAGPSASYSNGDFVGRDGLPTVSSGETFTAGFGIDSALRSSRELIERSDTTQGGNRVIELTYRLTVENFGKNAAGVRLMDRYPQPKGTDIRVTLVSGADQLSRDEAYVKHELKNNILRWDVSVPAGATGAKAFTVEYKFRVEFDRQMRIVEGELK